VSAPSRGRRRPRARPWTARSPAPSARRPSGTTRSGRRSWTRSRRAACRRLPRRVAAPPRLLSSGRARRSVHGAASPYVVTSATRGGRGVVDRRTLTRKHAHLADLSGLPQKPMIQHCESVLAAWTASVRLYAGQAWARKTSAPRWSFALARSGVGWGQAGATPSQGRALRLAVRMS